MCKKCGKTKCVCTSAKCKNCGKAKCSCPSKKAEAKKAVKGKDKDDKKPAFLKKGKGDK